jgi:hypothetical protein
LEAAAKLKSSNRSPLMSAGLIAVTIYRFVIGALEFAIKALGFQTAVLGFN